jgi:hypothetical protein
MVELVLLYGNTWNVILVEAIQTLMCFDNWSCFSLRQKFNTYSLRENMSAIECASTSQCRCHNCSCAMNVVVVYFLRRSRSMNVILWLQQWNVASRLNVTQNYVGRKLLFYGWVLVIKIPIHSMKDPNSRGRNDTCRRSITCHIFFIIRNNNCRTLRRSSYKFRNLSETERDQWF